MLEVKECKGRVAMFGLRFQLLAALQFFVPRQNARRFSRIHAFGRVLHRRAILGAPRHGGIEQNLVRNVLAHRGRRRLFRGLAV